MSKAFKVLAGLLAIIPVFSVAANADNYRYYYNNGHGYHRHHRYDDANWKAQRTYLRSNMGRVPLARQRELDAQMRAQFRAYHNNNWNGSYTWQNYSDPAFLDYLRNRNPTVLDTVFNYLGR